MLPLSLSFSQCHPTTGSSMRSPCYKHPRSRKTHPLSFLRFTAASTAVPHVPYRTKGSIGWGGWDGREGLSDIQAHARKTRSATTYSFRPSLVNQKKPRRCNDRASTASSIRKVVVAPAVLFRKATSLLCSRPSNGSSASSADVCHEDFLPFRRRGGRERGSHNTASWSRVLRPPERERERDRYTDREL